MLLEELGNAEAAQAGDQQRVMGLGPVAAYHLHRQPRGANAGGTHTQLWSGSSQQTSLLLSHHVLCNRQHNEPVQTLPQFLNRLSQ